MAARPASASTGGAPNAASARIPSGIGIPPGVSHAVSLADHARIGNFSSR